MRGLIVYEGRRRDAERVARALLSEVEAHGHSAEVVDAKSRRLPTALSGVDFVFLGASAPRIGKVPRRLRTFIRRLDVAAVGWTPICVFDIFASPQNAHDPAELASSRETTGVRIRRLLQRRRLNVHHVVVGREIVSSGRLSLDALGRARSATSRFLSRAAHEVEPLPTFRRLAS